MMEMRYLDRDRARQIRRISTPNNTTNPTNNRNIHNPKSQVSRATKAGLVIYHLSAVRSGRVVGGGFVDRWPGASVGSYLVLVMMGISVVVAVFRAHVVSPAASIESETRPLRGRSDECRYVTKHTDIGIGATNPTNQYIPASLRMKAPGFPYSSV
ncbi:uncharacterized protein LAJ45_01674 [Morchella importuna]|uniref:uncharacterized protein n=1 Tax=Morchella importuna TaxID=1174673 RepID=UPI001E8EAD20|nr:uncharacterized protein LAJ45_01674 [Morchella importuna]KAH8153907.1 hypothetical protein LAJ45_01674 [Morchella importuna]